MSSPDEDFVPGDKGFVSGLFQGGTVEAESRFRGDSEATWVRPSRLESVYDGTDRDDLWSMQPKMSVAGPHEPVRRPQRTTTTNEKSPAFRGIVDKVALPMVKASSLSWISPQVQAIHKQEPPVRPMHMTLCFEKKLQRPHFCLLVPEKEGQNKVMVCRRKKNRNKFRISLDPNNMKRKNNPSFAGTIKANRSMDEFIVKVPKLDVAHIRIKVVAGEKHVDLELLHEFVNNRENGRNGVRFTSIAKGSGQEILDMKVDVAPTRRSVLVLGRGDAKANEPMMWTMDFDYPLTIFLCFALVCVCEIDFLLMEKP
eukprot:TRINITY_DN26732_c0_g1_i1.p1 TRINITY_DN26732_c0_g1~~TRINITY_DN26732_c0_g1_i1.p1  ORF type:complete len:333 (-),score=55.49 TRINITY_DN26732_c0_g1_i1:76-1011(-)